MSADKISKAPTVILQFTDLSLFVAKSARGFDRVNKAGKVFNCCVHCSFLSFDFFSFLQSTLLRCLGGRETPDRGSIIKSAGTRVVFVEQDQQWGDFTVTQAIFADSSSPQAVASCNYVSAMYHLETLAASASVSTSTSEPVFVTSIDGVEDVDRKEAVAKQNSDMETAEAALALAVEGMEAAPGAWEYQEKGLRLVEKMQVCRGGGGQEERVMMRRKMSALSGGEKKRVALAAALLLAPDVLLLDEVSFHHTSHSLGSQHIVTLYDLHLFFSVLLPPFHINY